MLQTTENMFGITPDEELEARLEAHPPSNADTYWLGLPLVSFRSSWVLLFLKRPLYRIYHHSSMQKVH